MLDSNGCNTTAAAIIVKLGEQANLSEQQAVVIGPGLVGTGWSPGSGVACKPGQLRDLGHNSGRASG
jgi:hypothetical protein